jgi:uncharacterized protein
MTTRDVAGRSPLHYAAMSNDLNEIGVLLAGGEEVDSSDDMGFTPLHLAAQEGAVQAAESLLNLGASVDAENCYGNTPLFVAVFNSQGRGDMIELLRRHGADPCHVNKAGQSPVGLARLIDNFDVAKFFKDLD